MGRRVLTVVVLAVVALPGARMVVEGRDAPDGFPLSTYPMFTRDRGRIVEVPAVVVNDGGRIVRLSPSAIAGTDQVIEAHNVVARAIRDGVEASADLCAAVAEGQDDLGVDASVEVVVERYDAVAWSAGAEEPQAREVVASCR